MLPVTNRLADLAAGISKESALAEQFASKAVMHAINTGRMLAEAKELLPHGQFMSWVAENTTLSTRNAQRYIKAFDRHEEGLVELTDGVTIEQLSGEGSSVKRKANAPAPARLPPAPDTSAADLAAANEARQQAEAQAQQARTAAQVAQAQAKSAAEALYAAQQALAKAQAAPAPKPPPAKVVDLNPQLQKELEATKKKLQEEENRRVRVVEKLMYEVEQLKKAAQPAPIPPRAKINPVEWVCTYIRRASKEKLYAVLSAIRRIEHPDRVGGDTEMTSQLNIMIEELK